MRLDVAKFQHREPEEMTEAKEIFRLLLLPYLTQRERDRLAGKLLGGFNWPPGAAKPAQAEISAALQVIFAEPRFPGIREPLERLLHIRSAINDRLLEGAMLTFAPAMQAMVASLSRTRILAETMGESSYQERLLAWLKPPRWRIGARILVGSIVARGRELLG